MLSQEELIALESQRKYFIENRTNVGFFQWITSKGTNFSCYIEYKNSLDNETILNNKIDSIRTIIYALHKPLQFTFFYWTMLIFILHKFNFKKPVMKIILAHFILRCSGDIINKLGGLMSRYYANEEVRDQNDILIGYKCTYAVKNPEMHPLRWFLTRQIGCTLWCLGEIVADWYPLLRTKALAWDKKSIKLVYFTCALFNLSKVCIFTYHYTFSPTQLYDTRGVYDQNKVDYFYFPYWLIQLAIIYTSVIYDFSVYYVLKKNFSEINYGVSLTGFFKKFQTLSQYRILISTFICVIFLPIISITLIFKVYYFTKYHYHKLNFSFDEIRQSINNVQYFMIFIDQILLLNNNDNSSSTTEISLATNHNNLFNNNSTDSKSRPMSHLNSSIKEGHTNLSNVNQNNIFELNNRYNSNNMNDNLNDNNNDSDNDNINNINNNNNNNRNRNYLKFPIKSLSNNNIKTIANYDNYIGIKNEWDYLRN